MSPRRNRSRGGEKPTARQDEPGDRSGRREPIPEEEIPAWDPGLRPAGAKAPVAVARSPLDGMDGLAPATE